jgi:hypothetical protein
MAVFAVRSHTGCMSLQRYLIIAYFWTVGLFGLIGFIWNLIDPEIPALGFLLLGPVAGIFNVFVNIWPWARRVPPERRDSFWSYRGTNIVFFLIPAGILVLLAIVAVFSG